MKAGDSLASISSRARQQRPLARTAQPPVEFSTVAGDTTMERTSKRHTPNTPNGAETGAAGGRRTSGAAAPVVSSFSSPVSNCAVFFDPRCFFFDDAPLSLDSDLLALPRAFFLDAEEENEDEAPEDIE